MYLFLSNLIFLVYLSIMLVFVVVRSFIFRSMRSYFFVLNFLFGNFFFLFENIDVSKVFLGLNKFLGLYMLDENLLVFLMKLVFFSVLIMEELVWSFC